ncbi:CPBP family intramembrane glutamic endopeptidase [Peribacillus tepidiphilus]|uniref:CPBP family intramembrane glutamic endopeptidase n=1 Tax=Peribacillus tepidiphilus TaxID=2652445 RepID=UPI0035B56DD2
MKKEYWFIIIAYIAMQLTSIIGIPIFMLIGHSLGFQGEDLQVKSGAYWIVFSFLVTLFLILFFLRKDMKESFLQRSGKASVFASVLWAIGGVFIAMYAQAFAAMLEKSIGIEPGSENTQRIISLIETVPMVVLVSSIVGPILEEIVFRKIIFGELYKRMNFFFAAIISSVLFGFAHFEPIHILLYTSMGLVFAFLYVRTKRILVPIFAHMAMNTLVVILQFYMEDIERYLQNMEQGVHLFIFRFIGGIL